MDDVILGEIQNNPKLVTRVALTEWQGENYIAIRQWYMNQAGEWKPSQKGVNIKVAHMDNLMTALEEGKILLKEAR